MSLVSLLLQDRSVSAYISSSCAAFHINYLSFRKKVSNDNFENMIRVFYRSSYFLLHFQFLCEDTKLCKQLQIELWKSRISRDLFRTRSVSQAVGWLVNCRGFGRTQSWSNSDFPGGTEWNINSSDTKANNPGGIRVGYFSITYLQC
jgi:hypothetical protein